MEKIGNAQNIWRKGNKLVMRVDAILPDRCVKTNQPANGNRLTRSLLWSNPFLMAFLFVLGPIGYLVIWCCAAKSATITMGISKKALRKCRIDSVVGFCIFLIGIGLFVLAVLNMDYPALFIFGLTFLIGGLALGIGNANIVSVTRITKEYVWLKGINKDYLAEFPDWSTKQNS